MTLKEAYRVLRRFYDWRYGLDRRRASEAFPDEDKISNYLPSQAQAFEVILASQGLDKPIAFCGKCQHFNQHGCSKGIKGECTKWEAIKE
jgi:hypothetical protein